MNTALIEAVSIDIETVENQLSTELALLFHTRRGKLELTTVHKTRQKGLQVELMPGKPLTPDQESHIVNLMLSAGDEKSDALEFIPEGVLADNARFTLWFIPEAVRPMHFHDDKGRQTLTVYWPNLVVMAAGNKLFLAAVKGNKRPTPDSKLYFAPCANVWSNTEICQGDAKSPRRHGLSQIPLGESVIFDSAFSHANNRQCIADGKEFIDPMDYWRSEQATAKFPAKALVPMGVTLTQWSAFTENGRY